MARVTASRLQRLQRCPGYRHLDWVDSTNAGARRGTELHNWAYEHVANDEQPTTQDQEAVANKLASFKLEGATALVPELAFSYYDDGVDTLGTNIDRNYGEVRSDNEVCGSFDLIAWNPKMGIVYVVDYKTGWTDVPHPEDNWQLKFGALCAWMAHPTVEDEEDPVFNCRIWKINNGTVYETEHTFTSSDLSDFKDELDEALSRSNLTLGDHCSYCPAFASCPLQAKAATALVEHKGRGLVLNDETLPDIYEKIAAVKTALKYAEDAVKKYVESNGPVTLPDGRKLKVTEVAYSAWGDEAVSFVENEFPKGVVDKIAPRKMSASSIRKSMRKQDADRLLRTMRERGFGKATSFKKLGATKK